MFSDVLRSEQRRLGAPRQDATRAVARDGDDGGLCLGRFDGGCLQVDVKPLVLVCFGMKFFF